MKLAMKRLANQEWSVDFLIYLLRKARAEDLKFKIIQKDGTVIEVLHTTEPKYDYEATERVMAQDELDALLGLDPRVGGSL
jgi:hypothetical protein